MNKVLEIGYPVEYEDDKHIIRTGLWLKEYEVELLEKKLKELKQLKKQKDEVVEYIKYQLSNLDLEKDEDMKAKMLGSMIIVMLEDNGMLGEIDE